MFVGEGWVIWVDFVIVVVGFEVGFGEGCVVCVGWIDVELLYVF